MIYAQAQDQVCHLSQYFHCDLLLPQARQQQQQMLYQAQAQQLLQAQAQQVAYSRNMPHYCH